MTTNGAAQMEIKTAKQMDKPETEREREGDGKRERERKRERQCKRGVRGNLASSEIV